MYAVTVETPRSVQRTPPLYWVNFETSRSVGARNNSCTQLLWKPRDPGRQGTPIYLCTFDTSRPVGQGTLHVRTCCGNPATRARKAHTFISYLWNFMTQGARHSSCKQLLRKPRNPGRQGTPIYLVTFENSRPMGARNTSFTQLLRKPRHPGRQGTPISVVTVETWRMYTPVYYNSVVVPSFIVKIQIMCTYVYYTVVSVPGEPLRSKRSSPN
jgi:hypothetical protein